MTNTTAVPAPRHPGHRDVFNSDCDLCGAPARSTCAVGCYGSLGAEFMTTEIPDVLDSLMCVDECGNDCGLDGFYAVFPDGRFDPECSQEWSDQGELICCGRCGRVASQHGLLDGLDAIQVLFTLDTPVNPNA